MEMEPWTRPGKELVGQVIKESIHARQESIGRGNWSQRKMAEKSGISHVTLGHYCQGTIKDPSKDNYRVIKAIAPYVYQLLAFDGESPVLDTSRTYETEWQALYCLGTRMHETSQSSKIKTTETDAVKKTEPQLTKFEGTEIDHEEESMLLGLIPEQIARRGVSWEQFTDSYFFLKKLSKMLSKPTGNQYSIDELIEICDRGLKK